MNHLSRLAAATYLGQRFITTFSLVWILAGTIFAQVQSERYVSMVSNSRAYYEYLPKGYNAADATTYPLILFIHGAGDLGNGSVDALKLVRRVGPPKEIFQGTFPDSIVVNGKAFKFIVISPQFLNWPTVPDIHNVLNYIVQNYKVDLSRIYLTGLSMGGGSAWDYPGTQSSYANRIAAIVPVAGLSSPDNSKARNIANANIAVWATHNQNDPTVPVSYTNDFITRINTAPAPVPAAIKTIFNSNVHDAWTTTYSPSFRVDNKNIYEWMLQYARTIAPPPNQSPAVSAGADQVRVLPVTSTNFTGAASDPDGTVVSHTWSFVSGPAVPVISAPAEYSTTVTGMTATGVYTFRLTAVDNTGAVGTDNILVTINNPAANQAPSVNAGADQLVVQPSSSVTLSGNASDADGAIASTQWSLVSGPATPAISSSAALVSSVTGLTATGVYTFRLTAVDNLTASSSDDIAVTVNAAPVNGPTRQINVNLYSSATYNNAAWNNWNVNSSLASPVLKYSDGTTSSVTSVLSGQTAVSDNGASYSVTMCPQQVGRDVSYSTTARTNTLNGLDNGKLYDLDLFASRSNSGQTTRFTINGVSVDIATHNNVTKAASFTNIAPVNGKIVITLTNLLYYNYLNGFTLTEKGGSGNQSPVANAGSTVAITLPQSSVTLTGSGSDADGTIASYAWSQVSGTSAVIGSPASASTAITGLTTAGARVFRLTVTDNAGASGTSDVTVNVNAVANQSPVVNAGSNQTISSPVSSVSLSGTASDADGSIASYSWTQLSGTSATIVSPASATTNITGLTGAGTRVFRLTVTDNLGATASATVNVTVTGSNVAPISNAGPAQTILLPVSTVTLSGSGTDADGTIVSYLWEQLSGGPSTITSPASAVTTITALTTPGARVYRLTVTDNNGATAVNNVNVTVNVVNIEVPAVTTAATQTVTSSVASLSSTASGSPAVSTKWTKVPLAGQPNRSITVIGSSTAAGTGVHIPDSSFVNRLKAYYKGEGLIDTIYNFAIGGTWVMDAPLTEALNKGSKILLVNYPSNLFDPSNHAAVMAKFQAIKDSCDARGVQFYTTGTQPRPSYIASVRAYLLVLNDSLRARFGDRFIDFSTPMLNPVDNTILPQYDYGDGTHINTTGHERFFQIVKAANIFQNLVQTPAVITDKQAGNTTATGHTNGVYRYQVSVFNNVGLAASAVTKITVNIQNQNPVANAGTAQTIQLPLASAALTGNATDSDGTVVSYLWSQVSGTSATITSPASANTTVTGLTTAGARTFRLTVTDNLGATGFSDVIITVIPVNQPPVAVAGADQEIQLPVTGVTLSGTASDPDGSVVSYQWVQVSGEPATIATASVATTQVTGLTTAGIRRFSLTVTDNQGATHTSELKVTVNAAGNIAPVANAGTNKTVQLPATSVTLNGSGTDADGTIASYQWSQVNGPTAAIIGTANEANTSISGLTQPGTYTMRLTVVDDLGLSAFADVTITVLDIPNVAPVTSAGNPQTIQLPVSGVTLTGSASDADGSIVTVAWAQVSGTPATITTASVLSTTITGMTTAGARVFRLTVTDDDGATANSDVTITVRPANVAPAVNAGADKAITLPTNNSTLTATATDADGTISSMLWSFVSGPSTATIGSPAANSTAVSGMLLAGTYVFRFTATDNNGATVSDDVLVVVSSAPVVPSTRTINVNLYSAWPYVNAAWNNWNVNTGLTSPVLKYSDGANSAITSVLSGQTAVSDNGASYAVTMCPQLVGRETSYSTTTRTNTLNGLDNSKLYDLRFYATRSNIDQRTRFMINGVTKEVLTHNNFTNAVVFTDIAPTAGKITITLANYLYYNYLNGFTLTEKTVGAGAQSVVVARSTTVDPAADAVVAEQSFAAVPFVIYPNPVQDQFSLQLNGGYTGTVNIEILNQEGIVVKKVNVVKNREGQQVPLTTSGLSHGVFFIKVENGHGSTVKQLFRL